MRRTRFLRRFLRRESGAAVVEFGLVVPILFLLVWGIISFSRAYQRLNTLDAGLREGARLGSTFPATTCTCPLYGTTQAVDAVKATVYNFSGAFGYPVDTSYVSVDMSSGYYIRVYVTNMPLFTGINFLGILSSMTVSRDATFRWESAP